MTTQQTLDGYRARSWRFLADVQRQAGMEFVVGKREGSYLRNLEGDRRVLDCGNGGGVHALGHRNPEIVATLQDAVGRLDAGMWTMPTPEVLALDDALRACSPTPAIRRSVPTLSSSISIDLAIMFSFRMTGRTKVLAYRQGYHGSSGLAALATGSDAEGWFDHYVLPREHSRFFAEYGDAASVESQLRDDVAAVILEPMNYETFAPAPAEFLHKLGKLCRERGVLLIIDETRTGLGRSGKTWMTSYYDVQPDMLILGKGLGGGVYPASAVMVTEPIFDQCMNTERWGYMASMAGSPIGALVAAKVLEIAQRPALLANVAALEKALGRCFSQMCEKHPNVFRPGTIRGAIGTIGLADETVAGIIRRGMFERNIFCHSVSEIAPRVLKFFPCLTSDVSIVDEIAAALDGFAKDYSSKVRQ